MQAKKPKAPAADPTLPRDLGKPLINPPSQVSRLRFSPCGRYLAAACFDARVRLWEVSAAEPKDGPALAGHGGWVSGLAFGPKGSSRLYSCDSWGKLVARDYAASDAKPVWAVDAAHEGWARMLAVAPDGSAVASCGRDGFVRLWWAKDGKKAGEFAVGSDTLAVAFSADGLSVLAGDLRGLVHQCAVSTGKVTRILDAKELYKCDRIQEVGGVRGLSFDPTGRVLAVAGAVPSSGGFVQCTPHVVGFDWASGQRTFTLTGESDKEGFVTDLRWHPTGDYLMAATSGQPGQGKVALWKPAEAKPFYASPKANCHSLDLHPDGRRMAASATNANSSGNGRPRSKDGKPDYPENFSPIFFWEMPAAKA